MENAMSNKGTPIAGVRSPLGTLNTSTPSKRLRSKQKALGKEVVEATNDGRASVDKLSQWLASESSKKQQHTVRSNVSATPVRIRTTPKIKKEDVAATNDKRVSVKTLSSWMNDDPFEQKKVRHIRTGAKVIAKSRIFEPTQTKNIAMNIETGSVRNKQAWLSKEAFKSETNNVAKRSLPSPEVIVRPYQMKKKKESPEKEFNSVKDKKQWLSNAFKDNNNHSINEGEIIKSKSVDSGESMNFSANDDISIQKAASIDDDVVMCSKVIQQPPVETTKSVATSVDRTNEEKDEEDNAVSVADRAKWLKAAFEKK